MRKILLCFFALLSIACTAQVQTINSQLKLTNVQEGTATDSVLVRGSNGIVKYVKKSDLLAGSGGGTIPSLQEVTNNGNITSHPIYAKEFRVETSPDSLMVLNNRYFTLGDASNSGNWYKYFALFDPNDYEEGFEFYNYKTSVDSSYSKSFNVYADVGDSSGLFASYVSGETGFTYLSMGDEVSQWVSDNGNFTIGYPNNTALGTKLYIDTNSNTIRMQGGSIRLNTEYTSNDVILSTNLLTQYREIAFPDEHGELATKEWVTANAGASGYYYYVGKVTQTGTDAPTATTLFNSMDFGSWVRASAGVYYMDSTTKMWNTNKTIIKGHGLRQPIILSDGVGNTTGQILLYTSDNGSGYYRLNMVVTSGGTIVDLSTISPLPVVNLPEIGLYD